MREIKEQKENEETEGPDGFEISMPDGMTYIKPYDQLDLNFEELKKEIVNTLSTVDPKAILDSVHYAYKTNSYEKMEPVSHMVELISTQAHLIPLFQTEETDEEEEVEDEEEFSGSSQFIQEVDDADENEEEDEDNEEDEEEEEEEEEEEAEEIAPTKDVEEGATVSKPRQMKNQFDFRERATQTFYLRNKDNETMTEETPSSIYGGYVSQWSIYDSYLNHWKSTHEREKQVKSAKKKITEADSFRMSSGIMDKIVPSLKIIEKMIQLNIHNEIAYDFKFFEDEADEFRVPKGTLLPLWRLRCRDSRKLVITCMAWNNHYPDMIATGLGSYDFMEQTSGRMVFYSLSNPSYPEFAFNTSSGVMSLDINQNISYLVAIGLYDGNVLIYNLLNKTTQPWTGSTCYEKHADPVWQIRWLGANLNEHLTLASISADGAIMMWSINKNKLQPQRLMTLNFADLPKPEVEGAIININNGGLCFDMHPTREHMYVLGTKEGEIKVCNTQHNIPLLCYKAHYLCVYTVHWNNYHPDIFISCSADWTIKIWDISVNTTEPMFSYDLGYSVEDVAWAPYSSTTFAAITSAGDAYVFDLKWDKANFICEQHLAARKKTVLTTLAFNEKYPILVVGDDKGAVTMYKISPNLRSLPKKEKKLLANETQQMTAEEKEKFRRELEYKLLENIISMSRIGAKPAIDPPGLACM